MNNIIKELHSNEFYTSISSGVIVVDCYARWCDPCSRMLKILPKFAESYAGKIKFYKLDVDENKSLCDELHVHSIPTFIVYVDGKEVIRWDGIKTLLEISRILSEYIRHT